MVVDCENTRKQVMVALGMVERYASEFCPEFVIGMAKRMATSFHKYGAVADAYPTKVDSLSSALIRIYRYLGPTRFAAAVDIAKHFAQDDSQSHAKPHRRTFGNKEYLMDAANFLMIEFMLPRHPDAHFVAEDASASPGRVHATGHVGPEANTHAHENTRRGGVRGRTAGGHYRQEGD